MICINYSISINSETPVNQYERKVPYLSHLTLVDDQTLMAIHFTVGISRMLKLELGKRRCLTCLAHSPSSPCTACNEHHWGDEEMLRVRMSCTYAQETSPLVEAGWCTPVDFPCNYEENAQACHSSYFLYIGRFNGRFKVGISQIARGKTKRPLEQGLNEAILLSPIAGLPTALAWEHHLKQKLDIPDYLSFVEKVYSFIDLQPFTWKPILKQLEPYRSKLAVEHLFLYPDFRLKHRVSPVQLTESMKLEGLVVWIQGNVAILLTEKGYVGLDLSALQSYEIKEVDVWEP